MKILKFTLIPLIPSAELLDKSSLKQHVKKLECHFLDLVDCTYEVLVHKGTDVHRFYAQLISMDVSRKCEHQD